MSNEVERLLRILQELQDVIDGEPEAFGQDYSEAAIQEVVEAWEAMNMLSDVYLGRVKVARGISNH